jgi:VIT1/CCC1 family predicted Fe2+/Mn2+ transporter
MAREPSAGAGSVDAMAKTIYGKWVGAGDFLSSRAEFDFLLKEKERSGKMVDQGKLDGVVNALVEKGLGDADAKEVVGILSKPGYRDFTQEFVLVEELGQEVPDDPLGPLKDGSVTFISFLLFGSLPLWVYVIVYGAKYDNVDGAFGISAAACALSLFALGWTQGSITRQSKWRAGVFMMINGSLASAAAYLVGWGIMQAIGNGSEC